MNQNHARRVRHGGPGRLLAALRPAASVQAAGLLAFAVLVALAVALAPVAAQAQKSKAPGKEPAKVFPYPIHKKTLANGLDVLVIETPEFKDVLSFNTMVHAGARNEIEPGKTGLAHLFEHILFRHRWEGKENGYEDAMGRLGAHNNAFTTYDVTFYHPLTFTSNLLGRGDLPGVLQLESARFKSLDFTEKIFRTEAGAVLGEYRRNASFPGLRMSERQLALMFPHHPYGHTTIGYLEDVQDMPNEYQAAVNFYDTYYRPNNCVVVIAGDVKADDMFAKVEQYYSDWKRKDVPPIPPGEPPKKEQRASVPWDADVAPLAWVSYGAPAFKTGSVDTAVMQVLNELLTSQAAPLYKKLRYEKQSASSLNLNADESFDPRTMTVAAQLYKNKYAERGQAYFDEVTADIIAGMDDLKTFSKQKNAKQLLDTLKSKYRYDFLAAMSSPANIAQNFAWYYRFERDPEVFEHLLQSVDKLTPKDIDAFAQKYFVPENRVVLTLAYQPKAKASHLLRLMPVPSGQGK